ncbi:peptidase family M48-domain-containing protein [Jimgerdemannia flammicorona]|uniref:Peptidase family M48-domain-containing protein n=1 Tax=Jimgerdemannia flammicorona TaxID=994334 RepID=A0A433PKP2_9FUNG|nr:peptidase family M48-domain-containing protein [Jimgerdemannia flammicorona]
MAAVLGHEIAHQLARHSAEKLSFIKIIFAFQLFLSLFIDPYFIFNRIFFDFGILMPFSRKCEIEADVIGLRLMAQACFDPREAIYMWQRMDYISQKTGEGKVPAFVSTHPAHKTRIKNLKKEVGAFNSRLYYPLSEMILLLLIDFVQLRDIQRAASDCYTEMGLYADMFDRAWANW